MKVFKRIIFWIMISLAIQFSGLLYLDKKVFVSSNNFKAVKVDDKVNTSEKEIAVLENTDYKVSFDSRYISDLKDGKLNITNTKTGESNIVKTDDSSVIVNYIWLADRNRILFVSRDKDSSSKSNFVLNYYDANKNESGTIEKLDYLSQGAVIDSIDASTLHNVTYIKVNEKGVKGVVYRIDINHKVTKESLTSSIIGKIEVIPHEDRLVYEDDLNKKIFATNPNIALSFQGNAALLHIDSEDIVYTGIMNGDKVSKITYGSLSADTSTWKTVNLDTGVDEKDILITQKGNILINDRLNGTIKDLTVVKEYSYKGTFLAIYDSGIASVSQGKLIKTIFQ